MPKVKRREGNDGGGGMSRSILPPIRPSLAIALTKGDPPKPIERKALRFFNGPKEFQVGRTLRIPDETVIEIRKLHHWLGLTHTQIAALFPNIVRNTIYLLCSYTTRPNLTIDMNFTQDQLSELREKYSHDVIENALTEFRKKHSKVRL